MLLQGLDSSASDGGQNWRSTEARKIGPGADAFAVCWQPWQKRLQRKLLESSKQLISWYTTQSLKGFLHAHPTIKQQVEQLGVHRRTLERAIRAADPDLVKRKVGTRKLLNNHQKEKSGCTANKNSKEEASIYSFCG
jgi:hypothetical protein